MGPLSPINDLAGVLIQQYSGELDETLEMAVQQELAMAKEEGLKGVKRFVDGWGHDKDYAYRLEAISAETASKLLQGEFKTFDELVTFNSEQIDLSEDYQITLFQKIKNVHFRLTIN